MADDLSDTDIAFFGSKYCETLNIDRLSTLGMKLSSHHRQNNTPTRAALLSRQYSARTGVYTVGGTRRFDWSKRPLRSVENDTNAAQQLRHQFCGMCFSINAGRLSVFR